MLLQRIKSFLYRLKGTTERHTKIRILLAIFVTSVLFAIPNTAFLYLDLQYRTQHTKELQYITRQIKEPDGKVVLTEYAYRPSPWDLPMRISTKAFLIVPALATLVGSFLCLFLFEGDLNRRYAHALLITSAIIPITYVSNIVWGYFYWVGYEWYLGLVAIFMYGSFIIFSSGIINGIAIVLLRRRTNKN